MIAAFGEILFDVYPEEERLGGAPFNFITTSISRSEREVSFLELEVMDKGRESKKFLT